MSNIAKAFDHGKAFIPFITCGDPSLEITEQLVLAMAFGNRNMGKRNITAFLSANGQLLLPGKWHCMPLVIRVRRREHKQNTFGNSLHAIVNTNEITVTDGTGNDRSIVVD